MRFTPRFLTHASTIALLGALGSLGAAGTASASAMQICPAQTGQPQTSQVLSNTQALGNNLFSYNFTVCNTSGGYDSIEMIMTEGQLIRDWELPLIPGLINPNSIVAPANWAVSIETIGVANGSTGWEGVAEWRNQNQWNAFDNITQVIHWYTGECFRGEFCSNGSPIQPGDQYGLLDPMTNAGLRFGFDASTGPGAAPYQASWIDFPPRTGDPDDPVQNLLPIGTPINNVPEPNGLALFAIALGALMAGRRRRTTQSGNTE